MCAQAELILTALDGLWETLFMDPLPPKPEPPADYDCCGGGCADCDLRRYHQALAEWHRLAAQQAAETKG